MEEKLGFPVFPGTLNVRLTADSVKMRGLLKKRNGVEILPASGYCRGRLFKAILNGVECAVIVPVVDMTTNALIKKVAVWLKEQK